MENRRGQGLSPPLCRLLAEALLTDGTARFPEVRGRVPSELDSDLAHFFVPLDPYFEFQMRADCMRHAMG